MTMYSTKTNDTYFQFFKAGVMSGSRNISVLSLAHVLWKAGPPCEYHWWLSVGFRLESKSLRPALSTSS